ncbi:MAG: nucleotidyltransferase family protein [Nanoarchaeota archaeon]|nr:nucleotidyltransferase family protein [Nanoarchaeota archaeon]MBU4451453.1 nucleotidyltransferase family protein [Nanoarchaeota archaeon]
MSANRVSRDAVIKKLVYSLSRRGAKRIRIFGSYARGEQTPKSDIDVLVEFRDRKSLLDFVRIEREVSEEVGKKVDLLTENAISPYLKDRIKKEAEVIYGA